MRSFRTTRPTFLRRLVLSNKHSQADGLEVWSQTKFDSPRCISKCWNVRANLSSLSLRLMAWLPRIDTIGMCYGPIRKAKTTFMNACLHFRKLITFLPVPNSQEKIGWLLMCAECRPSFRSNILTLSQKRSSCQNNGKSSASILTSKISRWETKFCSQMGRKRRVGTDPYCTTFGLQSLLVHRAAEASIL